MIIYEGRWKFIICIVSRLGHELVNGVFVPGFLNGSSEIIEHFDHLDCPQEEM